MRDTTNTYRERPTRCPQVAHVVACVWSQAVPANGHRAVTWAQSGAPSFAAVAYGTGFADQAHLAREVRRLAGVPPSELVG